MRRSKMIMNDWNVRRVTYMIWISLNIGKFIDQSTTESFLLRPGKINLQFIVARMEF